MNPFHMAGAWDPISGWLYETLVAARLGPLYDRFVAEACPGPPSTGTIVDVGCGQGQVSRRLAERNPDATVIGVDLSAAMVKRASGRHGHLANLGFRVGNALDLPLPSGSADVVVSVASLKHWPDRVAGVRECLRVLATGSTLVLLESDRECSFRAARAFGSYFRPATPVTDVVGGVYYKRFVAGQAVSLDELVGVLTRAGAEEVEASRLDDLPFVTARARASRERRKHEGG